MCNIVFITLFTCFSRKYKCRFSTSKPINFLIKHVTYSLSLGQRTYSGIWWKIQMHITHRPERKLYSPRMQCKILYLPYLWDTHVDLPIWHCDICDIHMWHSCAVDIVAENIAHSKRMIIWKPCGMSMSCPCDSHVISVIYPCDFHVISLIYTCDIHVITIM